MEGCSRTTLYSCCSSLLWKSAGPLEKTCVAYDARALWGGRSGGTGRGSCLAGWIEVALLILHGLRSRSPPMLQWGIREWCARLWTNRGLHLDRAHRVGKLMTRR